MAEMSTYDRMHGILTHVTGKCVKFMKLDKVNHDIKKVTCKSCLGTLYHQ